MIYKVLTRTNIRIMGTRKNSYNTGIASEYLVLSMLYRLGVDAYLTLGNRKSIDIGVIREDGTRISIDVKSVRGYSSIPVDNVKELPNHFIVFVVYNNKFDDETLPLPDFYIVPSGEVIKRRIEFTPYFRIFPKHKKSLHNIEEFKDRWELVLK